VLTVEFRRLYNEGKMLHDLGFLLIMAFIPISALLMFWYMSYRERKQAQEAAENASGGTERLPQSAEQTVVQEREDRQPPAVQQGS
jgi:hypothetical protein